ncbi:TRAP transporter substrate-binding protein DctP, partial [Chloroflexota bacterium]
AYLVPSDWDKRQAVCSEVFDKYLTGEYGFGESKVLQMHVVGTTTLHTTGKPVRKLEDLAGLQIRTPPGLLTNAVKALGGTPATISLSEVYSALEKGMVDGMVTGWTGVIQFTLQDVLDYHTAIDIGTTPAVWVMNLKTWNSLPPDIQKIFEEELNPLALEIANGARKQEEADAVSIVQRAGNTVILLSPEELARWKQATRYIADDWAAEMDAKGLPGTEIVQATRELSAKY